MQANSYVFENPAAFQKSIDSKNTDLFILKNKNGLQAAISNYGARWVSMFVPDAKKDLINVIAGFNAIEPYQKPSAAYYGATIGRYANRIANGRFTLEGKEYIVDKNNGPNHLHGGKKGFNHVVWEAVSTEENTMLLKYLSPDGEEGYPGNLEVTVRYTLTDDNEMTIAFTATTDQTTVINVTNHAYFNLNGAGNIEDHTLCINADYYTPINKNLIPIGSIASVIDTPFDFRQPKKIGDAIQDDFQLRYGHGYDHNFILNKKNDELSLAATAQGNISKIKMDVITTEPGMQFYSGNFMDGSNILANGTTDDRRTAFCLETQHFPDSPNQKNFPSTTLLPGDMYQSTTIFRFFAG
ncbi:MAG TPA: aldose epimerase family protein [Ferruginibacter sp.]|nr:aldose epimerase family protein [Ferruginibacter sp.]